MGGPATPQKSFKRLVAFAGTGGPGAPTVETPAMCDYSLEMYGSRPAREGERYAATRFPSGSIGFAAPGDPKTAVCMQCDTRLVLTDIPADLQARLGVGERVEAIFAQAETRRLSRRAAACPTAVSSRCRSCGRASAPISRRCSSAARNGRSRGRAKRSSSAPTRAAGFGHPRTRPAAGSGGRSTRRPAVARLDQAVNRGAALRPL